MQLPAVVVGDGKFVEGLGEKWTVIQGTHSEHVPAAEAS